MNSVSTTAAGNGSTVTFDASTLASGRTSFQTDVSQKDPMKGRQDEQVYLKGMRLHILTFAINLAFFLVHIEVSVVGTALVSITDDLKGYGRSSWIVTGYMLTYVGFMVIMAKLSDHIGRKLVIISFLTLFLIFSVACGAAQTEVQLIIFRVFQGFGAAGTGSLGLIVLTEMIPKSKFPVYSIILALVTALSLLLGPIIGGAIAEHTTWRWVFFMNLPPGAITLLLLGVFLPNNFPNVVTEAPALKTSSRIKTLDVVGATLMLAAIVLIITGFEEASNLSPWTSGVVLAPIVVSGVTWILFLLYERHITKDTKNAIPVEPVRVWHFKEPVFPWRFCQSRVIVSVIANSFILGTVFITLVIQIPLRYQIVNNCGPLDAGVRLIAFGAALPVGSASSAQLCQRRQVPPIYLLFFASALIISGLAAMQSIGIERLHWGGLYGLQFMTGVGCGVSMGMVTLLPPFIAKKQDLATCTAAVMQFRSLGGALAISLVTAVMNQSVRNTLLPLLGAHDMEMIFLSPEALNTLQEPARIIAREVFWKGFNMQLRILLGFAVAQVPVTMLMWKKEQVTIVDQVHEDAELQRDMQKQKLESGEAA